MKKLIIATGLLMATSAYAQTEVLTGVTRGKDYGVVYALPKTQIEIEIKANKVNYKPGEFSKYADRYLRLTNVSAEPEEYWELNSVKVKPVGVPNSEATYFVKLKDKTVAPLMELTEEGLIMQKKETILYTDYGNINETEEYEYNKYRLLTATKKYTNNPNDNSILETRSKYLSDLTPAVIGVGGRATARTLAGGDNGGKLDIASSGTLTLTGATDGLSHTEIAGTGTLAIAEGASLGLAADSTLSGVVLDLGGSLSLEADGSAGGLNGSGSLELNGQTLQIQAASGQTHTYEGTLGEGTLDVSGAGTQVLRSSGADTGLTISGGNLVLQGKADVDGARLSYGNLVNSGNLTIQASDNSLTAVNTTLSVENASFSSGSATTFTLNTDADMTASFIEASGDVVIEDGASFHVTSIPDVNITWKSGNPMELTLMELTGDGTIDLGENTLTVGGLFLTYYKNAHLVQEGDKVVLKAEEQTDNVYAGVADTANSMAGANLLWDAARHGFIDQAITDFLGALNNDMLNNPSAARRSLAAL